MTDALAMFADQFVTMKHVPMVSTVNADGRKIRTRGTPTDFLSIKFQPAKANELAILPEGVRLSNFLKTWSKSSLEVETEILYGGVYYRIFQSDPWPQYGNFYRYIVREVRSDEVQEIA
jgi:hypothetical protein